MTRNEYIASIMLEAAELLREDGSDLNREKVFNTALSLLKKSKIPGIEIWWDIDGEKDEFIENESNRAVLATITGSHDSNKLNELQNKVTNSIKDINNKLPKGVKLEHDESANEIMINIRAFGR